MKIAFVTATGADDRTDVAELEALSRDYPLEWGLLLWERAPRRRFPSRGWMGGLLDRGLPLSGHLCEGYVRDLLGGKFTFAGLPDLLPPFRRFQINFHGLDYGVDSGPLVAALGSVAGPDWIFQMDGVNDFRLQDARDAGLPASPLFDRSHGDGVVPETWPPPVAGLSGYAGGLGPDNVAEELRRIADVVGDRTIWVDAETRLRDGRDRFDLARVRRFAAGAAPYF